MSTVVNTKTGKICRRIAMLEHLHRLITPHINNGNTFLMFECYFRTEYYNSTELSHFGNAWNENDMAIVSEENKDTQNQQQSTENNTHLTRNILNNKQSS